MAAVTVEHIHKTYDKGKVVAIEDISFSVERGEVFGIIGPDGAGKTSLFRILTTLLLADSGAACVDGLDVIKDYKAIRSRVGYMPGKFSLYQDLTVEENLNFFATLFDTSVEENYELIKEIYVQIEPFNKRRAGKLSGGMKQKLALCCALIHKPTVLFLDEPTTGVDTVSRKEFWEMLKRLKEQHITILVSTPYMDEAVLCDRIALLQQGNVLSIDTPQKIIGDFPDQLFAVKASNTLRLLEDLRGNQAIKSCYAFGEFMHVSFNNAEQFGAEKLTEELITSGHEQITVKTTDPTIEDCFIRLMLSSTDKK